MRKIALIAFSAIVAPTAALAQSGEFSRPTANITSEAALCGKDWIGLSLQATRSGLSVQSVQTPKGDTAALARAVTDTLKDMKVASVIRIYCGSGSYLFEISGYTAWTGDPTPITRRFMLTPDGLQPQD